MNMVELPQEVLKCLRKILNYTVKTQLFRGLRFFVLNILCNKGDGILAPMEVTSFFEEVRREKDITDSGTEFSEKRKFIAPKKNATFRACVFLDLMVVLLSSFFVRK